MGTGALRLTAIKFKTDEEDTGWTASNNANYKHKVYYEDESGHIVRRTKHLPRTELLKKSAEESTFNDSSPPDSFISLEQYRKDLSDFLDTKTGAINPWLAGSRRLEHKQSVDDSIVVLPDHGGDNLVFAYNDDSEGVYGNDVANGANFHINMDTKDGRIGELSIEILKKHYVNAGLFPWGGKETEQAVLDLLTTPHKSEQTVDRETISGDEAWEFFELNAGIMGNLYRLPEDIDGYIDPDFNREVPEAFLKFAGNLVEANRYLRDKEGVLEVDRNKAQAAIDRTTRIILDKFGYQAAKQYLFDTSSGDLSDAASFSGNSVAAANPVEEYLILHADELKTIKESDLSTEEKILAMDKKIFGPLRSIQGLRAEDRDEFFKDAYYPAFRRELIDIVRSDYQTKLTEDSFPHFQSAISKEGEGRKYNKRISISPDSVRDILQAAEINGYEPEDTTVEAPQSTDGKSYSDLINNAARSNLSIDMNGVSVPLGSSTKAAFARAMIAQLKKDSRLREALTSADPSAALITRLFLSAIEADPKSSYKVKIETNREVIAAFVNQIIN
ncbi:MAG: hypothetical protein OXU45_02610 [Candidatus Melainabacteria bacterium]|nr:hypothetical protein [Candidatus Melainabacteria bacterium]